ncbi:MAG: AI-2E family transporter [Thermoleophilia bacterium]|nr:AI-2E family transporter [Thermoleophilia bacterium]
MTAPAKDEVPRSLRIAAAIAWRALVVAVALAVLALLAARLRTVVLPVLLAAFLATVFYPPARWLRQHGWPRGLAALAVVAGALAVLAAAIALVVPRAAEDFGALDVSVEGGVERVTDWLVEGPFGLSERRVSQWRESAFDEARSQAGRVAGGVFGGAYLVLELVAALLLTIVVLFFYVKDGDRIWSWVVGLFPERIRDRVGGVGDIAWDTLRGYLRGVTLVALFDAIFIGVALLLIGVPLVVPLALLTFVGGFFPIVGAVVAGFAAVMVALVSEGFVAALLVLAAVVAVQQIESNVLQPFVVGRAVALHPLAILLAVATGAIVWGVVGAFLAVPLAAVAAKGAAYLRADDGA